MEFGIRDIYDDETRPSTTDGEQLEQSDEVEVDAVVKSKRGRKSSKASYSRRQVKKVDQRPADVAAESDY